MGYIYIQVSFFYKRVLIIITMQTVLENAVIASMDKFVIKLTDIVRMGAIFISILLCAKVL